MAMPFSNLMQKKVLHWDDATTIAFDNLKNALSTTPILQLMNFGIDLKFICDAFGMGISVVL